MTPWLIPRKGMNQRTEQEEECAFFKKTLEKRVIGAGEEIRTLDVFLGKEVLYH